MYFEELQLVEVEEVQQPLEEMEKVELEQKVYLELPLVEVLVEQLDYPFQVMVEH